MTTYNGVPFCDLSALDQEQVNQGIIVPDREQPDTLTEIRALALAAITHEPSDHGKLSSVKMQIWQDALDDLRDELFPERVLAMIAVIDAAKAMHVTVGSETDNGKVAFDAAIAKLEQK